MGPAAHGLCGTSAAVATAGAEARRWGQGAEEKVEDASLTRGWVEGGGDETRTERCKEIKGMR